MTKSVASKPTQTYAGLDVSLKETAVCVVDDAGRIVFESMVPTDPQIIAKYLSKHAPRLERFGLESGSTSAWLWREFRAMGLPVICLDSRHAHRVLSMKRNKNDRNDARGLADLVRMGWYREARVRSLDAQLVRSMLLSRQQLLQAPQHREPDARRAQDPRRHDRPDQRAPLHAACHRAQGGAGLARPRARPAARRPRRNRQAAEGGLEQHSRGRPRGSRRTADD